MQKTSEKNKRPKLDQMVQVRCDGALILDFDRYAAKHRKPRAQVMRELMMQWIELQQRKSA